MKNLISKLLFSPIPGLFVLTMTAYIVIEQLHFRANAHAVEGEVVDLVLSVYDGDESLLPSVQYTDSSGTTHTFTSDNEGLFGYHEGQTVPVLYSEDGSEARLDDFTHRWAMPGLWGFMGLVLTGFGFYMMRNMKDLKLESSDEEQEDSST